VQTVARGVELTQHPTGTFLEDRTRPLLVKTRSWFRRVTVRKTKGFCPIEEENAARQSLCKDFLSVWSLDRRKVKRQAATSGVLDPLSMVNPRSDGRDIRCSTAWSMRFCGKAIRYRGHSSGQSGQTSNNHRCHGLTTDLTSPGLDWRQAGNIV